MHARMLSRKPIMMAVMVINDDDEDDGDDDGNGGDDYLHSASQLHRRCQEHLQGGEGVCPTSAVA